MLVGERGEKRDGSGAGHTERDQALSEHDQTLSEHDQELSERDQQASDEDQAASEKRSEGGEETDTHARTTASRADTAREREQTAELRKTTAGERDDAAAERDQLAAGRDKAAELADAEAQELNGRDAAGIRARAARHRELAAQDRERSAQDRELAARDREQAATDELTGARRRGAGLDELRHEMDRARRTGVSLAAAYVDVDDLKSLNDREGHRAGDERLREVADALRRHMRSYDLLVRVGGDEFVCVLPDISIEDARRRFERMRSEMGHSGSVSFGLSELRPDDSPEEFIDRADRDLLANRSR